MYLKEIKHIFHTELKDLYPKEEIDSFFYRLLEHYLDMDRFALVLTPDLIISKEEEQSFFAALAALQKEKPIQYIIGKTQFMDFEFLVNENVLIPRPETEELVKWIIEDTPKQTPLRILDIGTGTGCIAISLAKYLPQAKVYALDVSEMAIEVAKKNASANNAAIEFIHADILNLDFDFALAPSMFEFDIIVSNPPYVRALEKAEIQNNVKIYEPALALFVEDKNPLIFYKAITEFAQQYLKDRGTLYFEINQYLGVETQKVLEAANFNEIELSKDIFGNDRMLKSIKRNT